MKQISIFFLMGLFFSAHSGFCESFYCTSPGGGFGENKDLYSRIQLSLDGESVNGRVFDGSGWLIIGQEITGSRNVKTGRVTLELANHSGEERLSFVPVDGIRVAKWYEFVDGFDPIAFSIQVRCCAINR